MLATRIEFLRYLDGVSPQAMKLSLRYVVRHPSDTAQRLDVSLAFSARLVSLIMVFEKKNTCTRNS